MNVASVKIERLQKQILQDVAQIITQRLRDPRLRFGSVTGVKLAEDLRHAKIYVSCLGDDADRRTFLRGLESARGKIQAIVAKHLETRLTPKLAFEYDPGVERSIRISALIDKALDEDDEARAARGEARYERGKKPGSIIPGATAAGAGEAEEGDGAGLPRGEEE